MLRYVSFHSLTCMEVSVEIYSHLPSQSTALFWLLNFLATHGYFLYNFEQVQATLNHTIFLWTLISPWQVQQTPASHSPGSYNISSIALSSSSQRSPSAVVSLSKFFSVLTFPSPFPTSRKNRSRHWCSTSLLLPGSFSESSFQRYFRLEVQAKYLFHFAAFQFWPAGRQSYLETGRCFQFSITSTHTMEGSIAASSFTSIYCDSMLAERIAAATVYILSSISSFPAPADCSPPLSATTLFSAPLMPARVPPLARPPCSTSPSRLVCNTLPPPSLYELNSIFCRVLFIVFTWFSLRNQKDLFVVSHLSLPQSKQQQLKALNISVVTFHFLQVIFCN